MRRWAAGITVLLVACLVPATCLVRADVASALAPTLTATVTPATCTAGNHVTITAAIDVPGAVLTVSRMRAGEQAFTVVHTMTAGADGTASWAPAPPCTTTYSVDYAGDFLWEPVAASVAVSVRPRLRLRAPASVYGGDKVTLRARVLPSHPGAAVVLQRRVDGVWTAWRTLTLDAESRATSLWHPRRLGRVAFRLVMDADADHLAGVGSRDVVKVKDPNPYDIPVLPAHFIVVDVSKYRLYYHEHGRIVRVFDCVLGKPSTPTPRGHFRIYNKQDDTGVSYGPRRMRYWFGYAIHGTNEPWLLSRFPRDYSHGCTRLSNTDIIWLYARCPVGTPVWNVP